MNFQGGLTPPLSSPSKDEGKSHLSGGTGKRNHEESSLLPHVEKDLIHFIRQREHKNPGAKPPEPVLRPENLSTSDENLQRVCQLPIDQEESSVAIKTYSPVTPSRRSMTGHSFEEITRHEPEKSLVKGSKDNAGRNSLGRLTVRRRGGGHKRSYRIIDFKRDKFGIPAKVASIEYDPNRSGRIALLHYADGEKRYIIAPLGLQVGDTLNSGPDANIKVGNALPLEKIPLGTSIHNVEMLPGKGGQLVRSAGAAAQLVDREGKYARLRMPSGEIRLLPVQCMATIGQVGNVDHTNISIGKAGRSRWLGHRPKVRGVAMNPHDHPHGGGEGKSSGGRHPVTPWGVPTRGYKTRNRKKRSSQYIVSRRK